MTPEIYAARHAILSDELDMSIAVTTNEQEIPDKPKRYMVLEKSDGNTVAFADFDTLGKCVDYLNTSETERTGIVILDLDTTVLKNDIVFPDELYPVESITKIIGTDWKPQPPASTFSPRELATVLYALRGFQERPTVTTGSREDVRRKLAFSEVEPLDFSEIDSLCERLSAVKPESVNAELLSALQAASNFLADENDGEDEHYTTLCERITKAIARAGAAL